jgi:EAL domain-containing protein (putative c-di-GMP-specific phosphodiesterase class I)
MPFPALHNYLARLADPARAATSVWTDSHGHAHGRYFNCTITSAFQPIRELGSGRVVAYEGLARSMSASDKGLSLWRLLDHAASDDESIELDRLCRMVHSINFFRQPEAESADLYLSVHDRLLSAVSSNHGYAFQRILDALSLPIAKIVLQLPPVSSRQTWLLRYVADNYSRNGFRLALNTASPEQALDLLRQVHPSAIKVDARPGVDGQALASLLSEAKSKGVDLIFKRLDSRAVADLLQEASIAAGVPVHVQGHLVDMPQAGLAVEPWKMAESIPT